MPEFPHEASCPNFELWLNHRHNLNDLSKMVKAMAPVIDIQGKTGCDGKDGEDQGG